MPELRHEALNTLILVQGLGVVDLLNDGPFVVGIQATGWVKVELSEAAGARLKWQFVKGRSRSLRTLNLRWRETSLACLVNISAEHV